MMRRAVLLVCLSLGSTPAVALVGNAPPASSDLARHSVMIVGSRGNFCTGAALTRDLVLTAAHCVPPGSDYKLVEIDADRRPHMRDVATVVRHPQFNLQTMLAHRATADVALLKLAEPLPARFAPAPIGEPPQKVTAGDQFTVAGYGLGVRGDPTTGGTIRMATLTVTGRPGTLQIRLVDPATRGDSPGLGACTGDSGAPVLQQIGGRQTVIGVVSWSTGPKASAGCGGLTGVTPLSLYRGWIAETAARLGSTLARQPFGGTLSRQP